MGFLTLPLALLGLVGLPVLGGIYWLRNRFQRQQVSSLVLWTQYSRPKEGGRTLQRIQTPLLFFLELLILLLLVLAATRPMIAGHNQLRHLLVVLDDSYSMQAQTDGTTVRQLALERIEEQMGRFGQTRVRFIRAGVKPQVLGPAVQTLREAQLQLQHWTCEAPQSDLEKALALARELSHAWTDILVVTDQAPLYPLAKESGIVWQALGQALPNLAIVHAARSDAGEGERVLVEVKETSGRLGACELHVTTRPDEGEPKLISRQSLTLRDGRSQRIILDVKAGLSTLEMQIVPSSPDGLSIDNRVLLLPEQEAPVRVRLHVQDERLRSALEEVMAVTDKAIMVDSNPELFISDSAGRPADLRSAGWSVRFHAYDDAVTYTGPYTLDASEALTDGLSLRGVLWGAGKPVDPNEDALRWGKPVLLVGNLPLMTLQRQPGRGAHLAVRFSPELSALFQSPNWPILIQNLLDTVASQRSGPVARNLRLGARVAVNLPPEVAQVAVKTPVSPSAEPVTFLGSDRRQIEVPAEHCGTYLVTARDEQDDIIQNWQFSVNALQRDESNLSKAVTQQWGDWTQSDGALRVYVCLSSALLLGVLTILMIHLMILCRRSRGPKEAAWV